ncbi:hypothetical protein ACVWWI_006559 [Bradyrhizobium sp. USDA 3686]|uniref:hypothetical protein n=1 Tax=Bradyrhizobium canariense TaxID=255045 RepID=UPI0019578733|nr:hypothetical protein [Bradyrhizobium canariense]MBM7487889.1 hypothetical protein [Bradyrhizobium canariense]
MNLQNTPPWAALVERYTADPDAVMQCRTTAMCAMAALAFLMPIRLASLIPSGLEGGPFLHSIKQNSRCLERMRSEEPVAAA